MGDRAGCRPARVGEGEGTDDDAQHDGLHARGAQRGVALRVGERAEGRKAEVCDVEGDNTPRKDAFGVLGADCGAVSGECRAAGVGCSGGNTRVMARMRTMMMAVREQKA